MSRAIWITGRPGRGKSMLAVHVAEAVQAWPVTLGALEPADARRALVGRDPAREWIEHVAGVQLVCPQEVCSERGQAGRWRAGGPRGSAAVEAAPAIALDYEASFPPELRLRTRAPDFRSAVEDALLLARRLHRAAAATVTHAEREVP